MRFSKSIIDIIKERTSRRTYNPIPLEVSVEKQLIDLLTLEKVMTPFSDDAGKHRFELVKVPEFDPKEKKRLGTYGLILGAQQFAYLMEYIILGATDMGLGTCWLGGTFNRTLFASKIDKRSNETIPAITPVGTFPEKRRAKEKLVRMTVKADKRIETCRCFIINRRICYFD